ncbi:MAG: hypothetical protein ABI668_09525 [Sphingorhabdus sp.]
MTLIASLLFLSALSASAFAIARTIGNAMPRIRQVIEEELAPQERKARRIIFGPVRQRTARVVAFPGTSRAERELKLAA